MLELYDRTWGKEEAEAAIREEEELIAHTIDVASKAWEIIDKLGSPDTEEQALDLASDLFSQAMDIIEAYGIPYEHIKKVKDEFNKIL